jgi:hypothetical protein
MFLQANDPLAPGAEPLSGSLWPGGRVDLEEANQRIDNRRIILDWEHFLKRIRQAKPQISVLFPLIYREAGILE